MEALGIDYGTSTTVFAGGSGSEVRTLCDDGGEDVVPSVLAFTPTKKVKIGKSARNRTLIDPSNTLYSIKRVLGQKWHSPDVAAFRKQYPFTMECGPDSTPLFVTRAGKLTAVQLSEIFLAQTREFASLRGAELRKVVVAVPERAELSQHEATAQAVQLAGFPHAETVSEPAAAVLAHLHKESKRCTVMVYDLGGGTFDTAVVRWDGARATVLASGGDSYLGGDDIDTACTDWAATEILKAHHWDVRTSAQSLQVLRYVMEQAKVRLSVAEQTSVNLSSVDPVLAKATLTLTRQGLEDFIKPLIDRSFRACTGTLGQVSLSKQDLDGVVLAGGTTYAPFVRHMVEVFFARPVLAGLPPDRVVAMGAALLAARRARRGGA